MLEYVVLGGVGVALGASALRAATAPYQKNAYTGLKNAERSELFVIGSRPSVSGFTEKKTLQHLRCLLENGDNFALAALLDEWDRTNAALPCGRRLIELATDIFPTFEDVPAAGPDGCDPVPLDQIPRGYLDLLESACTSHPQAVALASLTAKGHIAMGEIARGGYDVANTPNWAFDDLERALGAAEDHLNRVQGNAAQSSAHSCARLAMAEFFGATDDYVSLLWSLIRCDPHNLDALIRVGFHLLPRWGGSYEDIDFRGRQAAELADPATYAGILLGAMLHEPPVIEVLDPDLFRSGLFHWIAAMPDSQEAASVVLSELQPLLYPAQGTTQSAQQHPVREQLRKTFDDIARTYIRVILPDLWHGNDTVVRNTLAAVYAEELQRGARIELTEPRESFGHPTH